MDAFSYSSSAMPIGSLAPVGIAKQMRIQHGLSERPAETFDVRIFVGFTRLEIRDPDTESLTQIEKPLSDQFAPIIDPYQAQDASIYGNLVKSSTYMPRFDQRIDHDNQRFSQTLIQKLQDAIPLARLQPVAHKIKGPRVMQFSRDIHWCGPLKT